MRPAEAALAPQIAKLDAALAVLDAPAWTAGSGMRQFLGYDPGAENVLADSPFWQCVSEARREAIYCMQVKQGIFASAGNGQAAQLTPHPFIANSPISRARVPGLFASAKHQVLIAYQLATLLYATFDIRVPNKQDTTLWGDLSVFEINGNQNPWLASDCLDLTSPLPSGRTKDRYGLKPRLGENKFFFEDVGWDPTHPYHRTQWTPPTRIP
jgi:hypothetical protein